MADRPLHDALAFFKVFHVAALLKTKSQYYTKACGQFRDECEPVPKNAEPPSRRATLRKKKQERKLVDSSPAGSRATKGFIPSRSRSRPASPGNRPTAL
jgi:hypothetical protein